MTNFHMIYAKSKNGVIGLNGKMPWHIPEDLKYFKEVTNGSAVIMGRKTWDSLPEKFRPLPQRRNVVISNQRDLTLKGAEVFNDLENSLKALQGEKTVWVMGGSQLYKQMLPMASKVYVTEIQAEFSGDTYAPILDIKEWVEVSRKKTETISGLFCDFTVYERLTK